MLVAVGDEADTYRLEAPGRGGDTSSPARTSAAGCISDDGLGVPPAASMSELLEIAARTMGEFWWHIAQETGISAAGLGVLRVLTAHDGLKSSEVTARGWLTPGTVTSVVDTLVRDGLVERRRDEEGRRIVRLYVTGLGRRKYAEASSLVGREWRDASGYVSPADEPVIRKFLTDTIERFSALVRKEQGARYVTQLAAQYRRPAGELPHSGAAIRTEGLRKTYTTSRGDVQAVRGISLEVATGEFFGLLGPNGAGKSTTIGMLTTLIVPAGGRAWVAGTDVTANPVGVKRRIGVVPQNNTLDMQLTVSENLEFRSRFFGLGRREAACRADQLLAAFGLTDRRRAMATDLSGGQARRLMIARALVHKPDVLFLDEPTAGLDPQTRVNLWDTLRALHMEGQTILLTTHYMEEAEALCDQVAVIDHGEVLASGTVDELKTGAGADTVVTVRYDGGVPGDLDTLSALAGRPGVSKVEADGQQVRVFAREPDGVLGELVAAGARAGLAVRDAAQLKPSLETVFLTLTGREYRE
jgi:daunorubicin resistance ABC transporter ATP-binding subunit